MNPLAYPVSRIVGLEPRSATPAADTIPVAGSGGTIADGWLSSNVPRLNVANTFTANQTVNGSVTATGGLLFSATARINGSTGDIGVFVANVERWRFGSGGSFACINGTTVITGANGFGFAADGNTYIRNPSTGVLALYTGATERARVSSAGLDVSADTFRLRTSRTPSSATATGSQGESCYDGTYLYWCSATNTWQRIIRQSIATPAQFTANQNNWAPTIAKVWRVSTDAARDLTGINIGQWGGDEHYIVNVGSNNVVLKHQDTNSTAAYRFISVTGADITLAAGEMALLWYDSTSLRWRIAKV